MGGLFSKKEKEKKKGSNNKNINDKDKAMLDLKNVRDKTKQYKLKLEKEFDVLKAQTIELVRANKKDRALLLLKLKKLKEGQIDTVEKELFTVEKMINDIESATQNVAIFKALERGKNELNVLNAQMPLEKIEELLEESDEAIAMQDRISQLIGGMDGALAVDDTALEAELEALMGGKTSGPVVIMPQSIQADSLPVAPDTPVIIPPDQAYNAGQEEVEEENNITPIQSTGNRVLSAAS